MRASISTPERRGATTDAGLAQWGNRHGTVGAQLGSGQGERGGVALGSGVVGVSTVGGGRHPAGGGDVHCAARAGRRVRAPARRRAGVAVAARLPVLPVPVLRDFLLQRGAGRRRADSPRRRRSDPGRRLAHRRGRAGRRSSATPRSPRPSGWCLRAIQERAGLLGRWVAGLFGLAWTVATFLVVPVLVSENVGPVDAVKRSAELLKRTWGENVVGNVGIGFVCGLIALVWILRRRRRGRARGAGRIGGDGDRGRRTDRCSACCCSGSCRRRCRACTPRRCTATPTTGERRLGFEEACVANAFRVKA